MPKVHDFDPSALEELITDKLWVHSEPNAGISGRLARFTVFLPRWLITNGDTTEICTDGDQDKLRSLFEKAFGGCSIRKSPLLAVGRRGEQLETNVHHEIEVLASRWRGTWRFFRALRKELEYCSGEEQVLILHQYSTIV